MAYKLMAVDIDGTLLNSKGILTHKTVEAIREGTEKGLIFVISTGRPIQGVEKLITDIGVDIPVITYNGAVVITGKSRTIIYQKNLSYSDSKLVYNMGCQRNALVAMWIDGRLYVNILDDKAQFYANITGTKPIQVKKLDKLIINGTTKTLWYDDEKIIEKHFNEIAPLIPNSINFHTSRPYFLEFVDKNATKAIAMETLGKHYGIAQQEMIAIGDGYNDLSMIKYAGLGIAMANAKNDIKNQADFITKSNDEDGVAYCINKFIL